MLIIKDKTMITYVNDTTSKIKITNGLYELRGNFVEKTTEDGVSYECDAYRTKDGNTSFTELNNAEIIATDKAYLSSTDWIYAKCAEFEISAIEKYPDIVAKRKSAREEINELEDE